VEQNSMNVSSAATSTWATKKADNSVVEKVGDRSVTNIDKTTILVAAAGVLRLNGSKLRDEEKSKSGTRMFKMDLGLSPVAAVIGKTRAVLTMRIVESVVVRLTTRTRACDW